jgi:REP element-mobilizing transposase RayT
MSFVKIYVHAVWATKNRLPLLASNIRLKVFEHIKDNARSKSIFIDHINGAQDHLHCLISMNPEQCIADVVRMIKGESSHWINNQKLAREKFSWQEEYFAVSIGESQIESVRKYIREQEEHHHRKTFQEEYDEFMKVYGFNVIKG